MPYTQRPWDHSYYSRTPALAPYLFSFKNQHQRPCTKHIYKVDLYHKHNARHHTIYCYARVTVCILNSIKRNKSEGFHYYLNTFYGFDVYMCVRVVAVMLLWIGPIICYFDMSKMQVVKLIISYLLGSQYWYLGKTQSKNSIQYAFLCIHSISTLAHRTNIYICSRHILTQCTRPVAQKKKISHITLNSRRAAVTINQRRRAHFFRDRKHSAFAIVEKRKHIWVYRARAQHPPHIIKRPI